MPSDNNEMKLEISNREIAGLSPKIDTNKTATSFTATLCRVSYSVPVPTFISLFPLICCSVWEAKAAHAQLLLWPEVAQVPESGTKAGVG